MRKAIIVIAIVIIVSTGLFFGVRYLIARQRQKKLMEQAGQGGFMEQFQEISPTHQLLKMIFKKDKE